jgi:hypothetical protein
MEKIILTRKELFDLVWSKPVAALLRKYDIKNSELKKILAEMNIPTPEMGHWQRLQYGKPVEIKLLPDDFSGRDNITLTLRDINSPFVKSAQKNLKESIVNETNLPVKVKQKLSKPDPLISEARESLMMKRSIHDSRYVGLNFDRYKGMAETKRNELRIRVSPANVGRALRFFDAFIKLLRARQHDIIIENDRTYAVFEKEKFEISLKERFFRTKSSDSWQRLEYQPSGILIFKLESYPYKEWKDGHRLIEDRLPDLLAWFELYAQKLKQERLYYEEQHKIQEEKERIEKEIKARKEKEIRNFRKLVKEANQWHQIQIIRSYISYIEGKALEFGVLSDELKNWIEWSKQKADWYDPVIIFFGTILH